MSVAIIEFVWSAERIVSSCDDPIFFPLLICALSVLDEEQSALINAKIMATFFGNFHGKMSIEAFVSDLAGSMAVATLRQWWQSARRRASLIRFSD
jgi:hypothetical protein